MGKASRQTFPIPISKISDGSPSGRIEIVNAVVETRFPQGFLQRHFPHHRAQLVLDTNPKIIAESRLHGKAVEIVAIQRYRGQMWVSGNKEFRLDSSSTQTAGWNG